MNSFFFRSALICSFAITPALQANSLDAKARAQQQQTLDLACQQARQLKIAPLRQAVIDDCVERRRRDLNYCQRYHRDFGEKSGQQAALFYDLPECEAAFEFQKSYRNSSK